MRCFGEPQCGSVHRRWNHQTPCNVSCDHTKSKHCIGWHNWKFVSQGTMLLTGFIHVGRHIILRKGIHHSLFCHMEVELGKVLSSYVRDVFCSHIYSPSNYNGLHSCTFDCRSELAFNLNVFSGEATPDFLSALQTAQRGVRISFITSYVNSSACISSSCTCANNQTHCNARVPLFHILYCEIVPQDQS
jgi:hypothetical protein